MSKVYDTASFIIGNTPLLRLSNVERRYGLKAELFAKLEFLNPTGSVKDRAALSMIDDAERRGLVKPGSVIIEPTSGNTGIGLASVCASRGYRLIIVMPETMSAERRTIIKAYGAELVLTEGSGGMGAAIEKAGQLAKEFDSSFVPNQFANPANPAAHRATTGPEIWRDTRGEIDILVAGVGTGGTITGAGEYLKSVKPSIRIIAVEPESSAVLSGGAAGLHGIQGIGAGFVPAVLNRDIIDEVVAVSDADAFETARAVGDTEGVLAGISSGAALSAAIRAAERDGAKDRKIVIIFPDSGERYLSSSLYLV